MNDSRADRPKRRVSLRTGPPGTVSPWGKVCARVRSIAISLSLLLAFTGSMASAQPETFTLNLRDTEIAVVSEEVSRITGRTLILDPALQGEVTVISAEPLDKDGVWALFQSILRFRGFVAVKSGTIWEVVSEDRARSKSSNVEVGAGSQDIVTRLLRLNRLPAAEAVRVLSPLVDESGYIEAVTDPNAIVVTDTRSNVDRISAIARSFDSDADVRTEVIRFNFAMAEEVGRAITEVLGEAGTGARISIDPGSNLLLVRGSEADIAQIRTLAIAMDVAPRPNPRAEIRSTIVSLQFGDAETVAEIVRGALSGGSDLSNPVAASVGEDGAPTAEEDPLPLSDVGIQASSETNAILVRGTQRQLDEVVQLIRALDVQRPQVVIEAAIVEVSGEVADRLGVQLGLGDGIPQGSFAASSFSNSGASLQSVLSALGTPRAGVLSTGLTLGVGSGDFGAFVQALSQSTNANLLSTPSVTTLDNRPATIVVGQNVPFRTGSFATDGNTLAPFTTIERRDVGITMDVLPRVTSGGIVRLEIRQEVSSLINANVEGAADLITNRRVINTTVEAKDGGTIVLGGLITDDSQSSEGKVPGLGDVPVLGNLFRARSRDTTRRTLFVFMRPTVLQNRHQVNALSESRLNRLNQAEASQPRQPSLAGERRVKKLPLEINGLY